MNKFSKLLKNIGTHRKMLMAIVVLALPAILEMSLNTLLGVADTMMISRFIGRDALSAVGFANQISFAIIFVFSSFNTGATAMIARSYGEKDYKKLNKIAGQAVTVNFLIGVLMTIVVVVGAPYMLNIFDVSQAVMDYMLTYFYIITVGMISMLLCFSFAAILRGSGDTMTPLVITGIANILNIIGNYVLITGAGPFPEMGVAGAALSTTVSRFLAMFLYIYVLFIKKRKVHIKLRYLKISKAIIKPLWKISYPGAVEQALTQGGFLTLGMIISKLDTVSEASFRILINLESMSFMPAVGLSIAAATLVGKALGEKDQEKASEAGYSSASLGVIWGIFMTGVFLLIPGLLIGAFTQEQDLIQASISVMFMLAINQPLLNFMIVMSGALRGAGDTKSVMMITIARLWGVFVPFAYVFIILFDQGLIGVWYAEVLSFLIFNVVAYMRFRSKKWTQISATV